MLVMKCPHCQRTIVWTDTMPLKGDCPTEGCSWTYDVHEELKKSVIHKSSPNKGTSLCPQCHNPLPKRWGTCSHCGWFVAGSRSFKKVYIFAGVVIVLILFSLIYRFVIL